MSRAGPHAVDPAGLPWWAALPPASTEVSCGSATHRLTWAEGKLIADDHPDAEGELVLGALGGDRSECVEVVTAWGHRGDDLEVLAAGPRSAADQLLLDRAELAEERQFSGSWLGYGPVRTGPMRRRPSRPPWARLASGAAGYGVQRGHPGPAGGHSSAFAVTRATVGSGGTAGPGRTGRVVRPRARPAPGNQDRARSRRLELLSLLALGPEFQLRLAGTVAAAWADPGRPAGHRAAARPALVAALAGRLAPAAQAWLGVDPDLVEVTLHEDAGWGRVERSGGGLRAALPVGWLASVWAAGLTVVAEHLVVAVRQVAWPEATVLAVREPAAEAVILKVHAAGGAWTAGAAG